MRYPIDELLETFGLPASARGCMECHSANGFPPLYFVLAEEVPLEGFKGCVTGWKRAVQNLAKGEYEPHELRKGGIPVPYKFNRGLVNREDATSYFTAVLKDLEASGRDLSTSYYESFLTGKRNLKGWEISDLWAEYKSTGNIEARNKLTEIYLPLVRASAESLSRTLPKKIEVDDLTQEGMFGLFHSIGKFDPERGTKFKTLAYRRIRGSILDSLRVDDWVPRLVRLQIGKLEKARGALLDHLGRDPNDIEMAEHLGLTLEEYGKLLSDASTPELYSLSENWDGDGEERPVEAAQLIADRSGKDPSHNYTNSDILEFVTKNLDRKERLIIILYYYEGLTFRETGEALNLTESMVYQIHSGSIKLLKNYIKESSREELLG